MSLVDMFTGECEGCREREEIMGAGAWQLDALAISAAVLLVMLILYFQK